VPQRNRVPPPWFRRSSGKGLVGDTFDLDKGLRGLKGCRSYGPASKVRRASKEEIDAINAKLRAERNS